jgi:tRNA(Leu) C34 or U34 (ribose-2'-O)-methylase TrmL
MDDTKNNLQPATLETAKDSAGSLERLVRPRGFCCVALDNPKTSVNVGSALRAAGVYGANMIVVSGLRYTKAPTDTMRHHRHLPLLQVTDLHDAIPFDCVPVAVELVSSAMPLPEYKHPERAFYVFGAEDATLDHRVLSWCRDVVYIPTTGCMNLAATVNVVLYDRMCKMRARPNQHIVAK